MKIQLNETNSCLEEILESSIENSERLNEILIKIIIFYVSKTNIDSNLHNIL
jgi:hypothetical protein